MSKSLRRPLAFLYDYGGIHRIAPKNITITSSGRATCRRHWINPKNRFRGESDQWPEKRRWRMPSKMILFYTPFPFGDFPWRLCTSWLLFKDFLNILGMTPTWRRRSTCPVWSRRPRWRHGGVRGGPRPRRSRGPTVARGPGRYLREILWACAGHLLILCTSVFETVRDPQYDTIRDDVLLEHRMLSLYYGLVVVC